MSGTQSNVSGESENNRWAIRDAFKRAQEEKRLKAQENKGNPNSYKDALSKNLKTPTISDKKPNPLIKISNELFDVLDEMKSPIARDVIEMESSAIVQNGLGIELVDISKIDYCFDVTIRGRVSNMKIGKFVRYFFQSTYNQREVFNFSREYNKVKGSDGPDGMLNFTLINSNDYKEKQDPKDIKSTFISLVTKTYPYGHEEEVMHLMPSDLTKDEFGNYYKIIGESHTMFTSHLDTADRNQSNTILYEIVRDGDTYITTDGTTILGADDKSGVVVMLNMMAHNIPGIYYFFIGEERGGIGSGKVAGIFDSIAHLQKVKKCISFDRRNYHSVITSQLGKQCCSDEFALALCKELNANGLDMSLDPTGIYTDSANFIEDIPECTNISVGYFSEHTDSEHQNISFLEKLCKASLSVNWENLPSSRKVGFTDAIRSKYKGLFREFRRMLFGSEVKIVGEGEIAFIKIDFEDASIDEALDDLMSLSAMFKKHNIDPSVYFSDQYIKIELK